MVSSQDPSWWQARLEQGDNIGLVPSLDLEERRKCFVEKHTVMNKFSCCGSGVRHFFLKTDNFWGKSDSRNAKMTVQIFCKNDSINVFQKSRYKFAAHIYLLYVLYLSKSSPTLFKDVFRISFGFKRWKEANLAL